MRIQRCIQSCFEIADHCFGIRIPTALSHALSDALDDIKKRKTTITVKVLDATIPTDIELTTETGLTTLAEGDSVQLEYELIGPDEEVLPDSEVTWKSCQTKVARVSKTGLVTALRPGTVEIVARTKRGKASGSIVLVVKSASEDNLESEAEVESAVADNVEEVVADTTAELTEN